MKLDLREVPFSRRGSYMALSWHEGEFNHRKLEKGLYLRTVRGAAKEPFVARLLPLKNGEWQHDIPLSKGKYLVRMKIAVPKECAMEEGAWLNLRLQGRTAFGKPAGAFLDSPKIRPEAGQNYLLYNTLELGERAAKLQITANLFHFKAGSRVVISNIAVIPVGASE